MLRIYYFAQGSRRSVLGVDQEPSSSFAFSTCCVSSGHSLLRWPIAEQYWHLASGQSRFVWPHILQM